MARSRILIVDDSEIDRMMLRRAFGKLEIGLPELEEAKDANSAIACLGDHHFDAIFLDVNMPGEDGFFVLRWLRRAQPRTWPLVFMYSSSDHPDDVAQAYDGQATSYLCKPSDFDSIRLLMGDCMGLIDKAARPATRVPMS